MANRDALLARKKELEARKKYLQEEQRKADLINQQMSAQNGMSPFMSGVTGFNAAVERIPQGLMQLVMPNNEALQRVAQQREMDLQEAKLRNPKSAFLGEVIGDIGIGLPFMGAGAGAAGLAGRIPGVGQKIASNPYIKSLLGDIAGGGLFGGAQYVNPNESRGTNAALGAGIGGAFGAAAPVLKKLATPAIDMAKWAAKLPFDAWGALRRESGSIPHIMEDLLAKYSPQELSAALKGQAAGQRLGVEVTPAEAAQNKLAQKYQARLGITPEGERGMYDFGVTKKSQEESAIENLLNAVSPKKDNASEEVRNLAQKIITKREKALQERAKPHYEAAENVELTPNALNQLTKDGNINAAFKEVLNDPRYASEIEGYAPNSIKVLDEVKKRLDGQIGSALASGDKNLARILRNSKEKLLAKLDAISPDYKKARGIYSEESPLIDLLRNREIGKIAKLKDTDIKRVAGIIFDSSQTDAKTLNRLRDEFVKESPEAWNKIVRNAMEKKLNTKYLGTTEYHGTNFYRQILADKNTFEQFHSALKGNPKGQQMLEDMRKVFRDIVNQPTLKGAEATSRSSLDLSRSSIQDTLKMIKAKLFDGKYDKAMVDIITTDKWKKPFFDAMMEKSAPKKYEQLMKLLDEASKSVGSSKKAIQSAATGQITASQPYLETENYEVY